MALITAIPLIPVLESCLALFSSIPPIATTGILTTLQISFNVLILTLFASSFEVVVKIDPTPK